MRRASAESDLQPVEPTDCAGENENNNERGVLLLNAHDGRGVRMAETSAERETVVV